MLKEGVFSNFPIKKKKGYEYDIHFTIYTFEYIGQV